MPRHDAKAHSTSFLIMYEDKILELLEYSCSWTVFSSRKPTYLIAVENDIEYFTTSESLTSSSFEHMILFRATTSSSESWAWNVSPKRLWYMSVIFRLGFLVFSLRIKWIPSFKASNFFLHTRRESTECKGKFLHCSYAFAFFINHKRIFMSYFSPLWAIRRTGQLSLASTCLFIKAKNSSTAL